MESGALHDCVWENCWLLALADFGLRSSEFQEAAEIFVR